jgi:Fe-S-cluster containining protein
MTFPDEPVKMIRAKCLKKPRTIAKGNRPVSRTPYSYGIRAVTPPSITIVCPVICEDSLEAKNNTTPATSSGSPSRPCGDIFKELGELSREIFGFQFEHGEIGADYILRKQEAFSQAQARYARQNICCPFLEGNLCSIYEVRTYNCAGFYATTPPEWCNPSNPHEPKIYRSKLPGEVILDLTFYHKPLRTPVFSVMPFVVY